MNCREGDGPCENRPLFKATIFTSKQIREERSERKQFGFVKLQLALAP
jgi:hypothetical protein